MHRLHAVGVNRSAGSRPHNQDRRRSRPVGNGLTALAEPKAPKAGKTTCSPRGPDSGERTSLANCPILILACAFGFDSELEAPRKRNKKNSTFTLPSTTQLRHRDQKEHSRRRPLRRPLGSRQRRTNALLGKSIEYIPSEERSPTLESRPLRHNLGDRETPSPGLNHTLAASWSHTVSCDG